MEWPVMDLSEAGQRSNPEGQGAYPAAGVPARMIEVAWGK